MEYVKTVLVIVAHPDDETLWAGGEILLHPTWNWFVTTLCRKNDPDRSSRFYKVLKELKAKGIMGDLDDAPNQTPLDEPLIEETILSLLPKIHFNRIITHNPNGEYTRHLRHEEISKAVILLWNAKKISADELWTFAYDDGHKSHNTIANEKAPIYNQLTEAISLHKLNIITNIYGFNINSWEAKNTPTKEAFWKFNNPADALQWLNSGGDII